MKGGTKYNNKGNGKQWEKERTPRRPPCTQVVPAAHQKIVSISKKEGNGEARD